MWNALSHIRTHWEESNGKNPESHTAQVKQQRQQTTGQQNITNKTKPKNKYQFNEWIKQTTSGGQAPETQGQPVFPGRLNSSPRLEASGVVCYYLLNSNNQCISSVKSNDFAWCDLMAVIMNGGWKNLCPQFVHNFCGFEKVDEESKEVFSNLMTSARTYSYIYKRTTSLKTWWNWRLRESTTRYKGKKK